MLEQFAGIIDRDTDNEEEEGLFVLERRQIENYAFDPVFAFATALAQGAQLGLEELELRVDDAYHLGVLDESKLQRIVDTVVAIVADELKIEPNREHVSVYVTTHAKRSVKIPDWWVTLDKKELRSAIYNGLRKEEGSDLRVNEEEMKRTWQHIDMVPKELARLFARVRGS